MRQTKIEPALTQQQVGRIGIEQHSLYEPLDFVMVRAPLLPIETYLTLDKQLNQNATDGDSTTLAYFQHGSLAPRDPRILRALAIGSISLLDDLERSAPTSKDARRLKGKLLRFLIRMSTRPTPYGLFAGVALGEWGQTTDLALSAKPPRIRTRPDMAWLLTLVQALESRLDIRKHLRLVANPAAFIQADRVFLTERSAPGNVNSSQAVSIRASGVVKRALSLARHPIPYQKLADALLSTTPAATPEKVEQLLTELWELTLLLTDLRPPLSIDNPATYITQLLRNIPEAREACTQLESVLDAAANYDALPLEEGVGYYRRLVSQANEVNKAAGDTPVQVDMALRLRGQHIARTVGTELARAAELMLRMTPAPHGLSYFEPYRQAFIARYGPHREVPLLELLDPNFGLGSPANYHGGSNAIPQSRAALRSQTLLNVAYSALHDRQRVIELDAETLARLETWTPSPDTAPPSLDLNVFIAAESPEAIDAGAFQVIIGPNLGAQAAGRNLGRFADLIGPEAVKALQRAARAEEAHAPDKLWVELVYLPRNPRSANVVIRPVVREYELVIGTSPGQEKHRLLPLDELVAGVRNNGFYIRWPAVNIELLVTSGHMLNTMQASPVIRFLAEVGRERIALLNAFDWGPAWSFPFLPRVQVGRIVLREAQWRIDTLTRTLELPAEIPAVFQEALVRWRERWQVPRYIYLSFSDNRLLLDLESMDQVEELRTEVRHLKEGGSLVLQEVLPGPDQVWLEGPGGHYMTELVASLVLRSRPVENEKQNEAFHVLPHSGESSSLVPVLTSDRLKPPGSDWLFVKLYCTSAFEEELIGYAIHTFAEEAISSKLADEWFFIRYYDPDLHIRLRFHGEPGQLTDKLLPRLCDWATGLMTQEFCSRFAFDTYDREIERYGGMAGTRIAESLFAVDSRAVSKLINLIQERTLQLDRITLGVLSIDNLLASLTFTEVDRLEWLRQHVTSRDEVSQEYRQRKSLLRRLLQDPRHLLNEPGGEVVAQTFSVQRDALAPLTVHLKELSARGELSQSLDVLTDSFVHMHCNRLFGSDGSAERRVLGLLLRTREGLRASGV